MALTNVTAGNLVQVAKGQEIYNGTVTPTGSKGALWVDQNYSPPALKVYDGTQWCRVRRPMCRKVYSLAAPIDQAATGGSPVTLVNQALSIPTDSGILVRSASYVKSPTGDGSSTPGALTIQLNGSFGITGSCYERRTGLARGYAVSVSECMIMGTTRMGFVRYGRQYSGGLWGCYGGENATSLTTITSIQAVWAASAPAGQLTTLAVYELLGPSAS